MLKKILNLFKSRTRTPEEIQRAWDEAREFGQSTMNRWIDEEQAKRNKK